VASEIKTKKYGGRKARENADFSQTAPIIRVHIIVSTISL